MKTGDDVMTSLGEGTIYDGKYVAIWGNPDLVKKIDLKIMWVTKTKEQKEIERLEKDKKIWNGIANS